jgi:prevent-host-death family protein
MRYSTHIKPISYFKANAAEMLRDLNETGEPYIITQNGEAKAVLVDVVSFEKERETLALIKLLAMGVNQAENGQKRDAREVIAELQKTS